jgi:hypothetical protein
MRMIILAPKTEILYYVAFVDRGEVRRVSACAAPIVERQSTGLHRIRRPVCNSLLASLEKLAML